MNARLILLVSSLWVALAACESAPLCTSDLECGAHAVCAAGACRRDDQVCRADSQCRPPDTCRGGLCLPAGRCRDAAQCRDGERCTSGLCLPVQCQAQACPAGSDCDLSTRACELARCDADHPCAEGLACDPVTGRCRAPTEVASMERCNHIDDDLDGRIDEPFNEDLDRPCWAGEGTCRREGRTVCSSDGSDVVCSASAGAPGDELCDGLDNDCDGASDEGNPGGGVACNSGQPGVCAAGTSVCRAGRVQCDANRAPGAEACNGLDDDCDGTVDEAFGAGVACVTTVDRRSADGIVRCLADGSGTECVTTP
jgi:hypothetical protein